MCYIQMEKTGRFTEMEEGGWISIYHREAMPRGGFLLWVFGEKKGFGGRGGRACQSVL